jgi:cation diffusion facilitator family transporter
MSGHTSGDSRKVVIAALSGNALIAIAKLVAAGFSGSAAMLAEAVHSLADTANQALLLVGMRLASRRDPVRFPLGRATEVYFWAFVVSLMLFLLGGVFAIYEGVHRLTAHEAGEPVSVVLSLIVLGVSLALEGGSFWVASREFNRTRAGRPIRQALFDGRDPTIPLVLLEDSGAVVGLFIAFISIGISWVTGSNVADGIGSLVIGCLLCGIGLSLAFETHGLIIGEGVTPAMREQALQVARGTPGVEDVTQFLTMHLGPDTILLALKVRFARESKLEDVERVTDDLEARIRADIPAMKKIFVEADSNYDPALDPALRQGTNR